jgi:NAD(P)-dependent dehydrogenase (short-subunit alcohol dehydrogenase family)
MSHGLLAERVAFVTGAARGIGRSIASRFVEEGARVLLGDVDGAAVQSAERELSASGSSRASAIEVDVTSRASLESALASCITLHGRVDIVVANAGILYLGHVLDTPLEQWQRLLEVNLTGVFLTCQVFGRRLVTQGEGGRMILTSSLFGLRGGVENGAYSASKFGVVGLMQCLAAELASHNILVNAVCPGQVDTDMMRNLFRRRGDLRGESADQARSQLEHRIPLGRMASGVDIADLYVFLASDLNRYVTGHSLLADGGWAVGAN